MIEDSVTSVLFFTCMSIYWRYCRIMLPWWFQHKTVFQKLQTSSYTICTCISFNMTFNFISMLIDINYSLLSRQGQNCIVLRFTSSNEITTRVCKLTSDKWQDVLYIYIQVIKFVSYMWQVIIFLQEASHKNDHHNIDWNIVEISNNLGAVVVVIVW